MAPTRTCVGCRQARSADQLVRIVLRADGTLAMDRHGAGRGAWLCLGSTGCLATAAKRHGFARALKTPVTAEAVEQLCARLGEAWERPTPDVRG